MSVVKKTKFGHHIGSFLPTVVKSTIDNFAIRDFSVLRILATAPSVDLNPGQEKYGQTKPTMVAQFDGKHVANSDTLNGEYNLITSFVYNHGKILPTDEVLHAPVIDLDIPCELIPSTQEGHWHLYINKPITWNRYRKLLDGLVGAGLIEQGYYEAAMNRKYTAVRPVSRIKPGLLQRSTFYIKMAAVLRRENYYIKSVNTKLNEYVESLEEIIKSNDIGLPAHPLYPKDVEPGDPDNSGPIVPPAPNQSIHQPVISNMPVFKVNTTMPTFKGQEAVSMTVDEMALIDKMKAEALVDFKASATKGTGTPNILSTLSWGTFTPAKET